MSVSFMNKIGEAIAKRSPIILTGLAVSGVVTTAVLAVRATPAAMDLISEERIRRHSETEDARFQDIQLTPLEIVKLTWKVYIPTIAVAACTVANIISLNTIHARRAAALATAYSIADKALGEYRDKIKELVGPEKESLVREDILQDHLNETPVVDGQVIVTGRGETLCYDELSGRYFKSDIESIRRIENTLNHQLVNGSWLSVNELYSELGLEPIKMGYDLGWVPDNLLQLRLSAKIASNGVPCIVMDYVVEPKYDPYR